MNDVGGEPDDEVQSTTEPETTDLRKAGATFVRVEGPLDAIAVTLAGNRTHIGVAPLGTALTDHQADQLATPTPGGLITDTSQSGGQGSGPRVLVATDNDPAGRKAAEADYWKLITRGADPRELVIADANDPAELYQNTPQLLATILAVGEHAPSLAQSLIDTRITAWGSDLDNQWAHARLGAARHCAGVIAALPPEQWDDQVAYAAARIGEDRPMQMVYTEVIAAAINYDTSGERQQPAEQGAQAVKLADLAARLAQRQAVIDRRARDEALKTVAAGVHKTDQDPKVTANATAEVAHQAEKRRRDEQRRRHDTRPDGPARGPSIH